MNQTPTTAELYAMIQQLKAENEALRKSKDRPLSLKVSEKGAVSLYGLNRQFPVTLYARQWEKLLAYGPAISAFIKANNATLARKASDAKVSSGEQQ